MMRQHTPDNDKEVEDFMNALEAFIQETIIKGDQMYLKRENVRVALFKLLDINYPE